MVLTGYLSAVGYALACLLIAAFAYKLGLPKKYTRKIVHILVGLEWVILYHFMGPGLHFLIVCLLFLILLVVTHKTKLMPMISSEADNSPGTVYYAVAMSGVAAVGCFVPAVMLPFGIGVFCTSFGDGFAGVVGQLCAKKNPKIYKNKTLIGTLTNFVVSSASAFAISSIYGMQLSIWQCLAIGALSFELEMVTGGGFDNITVTWGTTALAYGFMYLGNVNHYLVPILFTAIIIVFATEKKALTTGGLISALALDILVSLAFGNFGFLTLALFFIGSVIIDKIKKRYINNGRNDLEKKNDYRDSVQVLSNGIASAVIAALFLLTGNTLLLVPFVASVAEAFADTAASGIGVFSKKTFDVFKWRKCERGISGGMSFIGTFSSLTASVLIALSALAWGRAGFGLTEFFIVAFAGFLGAIFDSFLGSVLQAKYRCTVCGQLTEKEEHHGDPTELCGGISAIDNDVVNVLSCAFSAVVALLLAIFI